MSLRFVPWRSLKARLTLFTLGIFALSIWAISLYASRVLQDDMQRQLGEQQFNTVSVLANHINDDLSDRLQALQTVAGAINPDMMRHAPALQTLLEQRPLLQLLFNGGVFVAGMDGTATADAPHTPGRIGTNYLDRESVSIPLREGRSLIGRPIMGKTLGAPIFSIATPIRDVQGRVIGVLVGTVNLGKSNFLDRITQSQYGQTGGYLLIDRQHQLFVTATDRSRVMLAVPAPGINAMHDRYMQGFEGFGVALSSRGVPELSAAKGVPLAGWILAAILPAREAFAPIEHLRQRLLLSALVFTLVAGALIWWLIRRMLRQQFAPMLEASRSLATQAASSQAAKPLPIGIKDEIGELIGSFNLLLQTLGMREAALKSREERLTMLFSQATDGILILGADAKVVALNASFARMHGYTVDDMLGLDMARLDAPETARLAPQRMARVRSGEPITFEVERRHRDGHLVPMEVSASLIESDGVPLIQCFHRDITGRKQVEAKLELAASVFEHAREGIMITQPDGSIVDVNEAFTRITGYAREDVLGQNPRLLSSGRHDADFYAAMWRGLIAQGHWFGEVWNRRKTGEIFVEMQAISAVRDAQGSVQHYVALFSDITAVKEHQNELEHMAHFDALTHLPNRVLLADRLQQAMVQAQRRGQHLAVAYLDLDGFKAINDQHGHEAGDLVLIAMAQRMKPALREGDTLARLGGDEFVAVLSDLDGTTASLPILERLLLAAAQPVAVGSLMVHVSASVGVSFFPQAHEVDADQLLRQADQAMYQSKVAGKNRYSIFDAAQASSLRVHHESLARIRMALEQGEFVLHYQPKINMRTGLVVGAEALIRWQHPDKGLLQPAVFLPVVEEHALAVAVGEWVLDTALTQWASWQAQGLDLPVSVNIGARQLQQPDFVARLRATLARHPQVPAGRLELEVLETSALEDIARVSEVIEACDLMGVKFALDDFGTGYSSLTYLKRLRVALLKIDQSFVRDMLEDPDDLAILQGVIGLAAAFKRQVIAEGVESVAHGILLLQLGCDLAQGYGIARPMAASAMPHWCAAWALDTAWSHLRGEALAG